MTVGSGKKELWDARDETGKLLGFDLARGEKTEAERGRAVCFHAVVDVVSIDENDRILLTRRDPCKHFPLAWEITGGSVLKGETPEAGAVRELFEETGIRVKVCDLIPLRSCFPTERDRKADGTMTIHRPLYYEYAVRFDTRRQTIRLQEGETVDYQFLSKEEFFDEVRNGGVQPASRLPAVLGALDAILSGKSIV